MPRLGTTSLKYLQKVERPSKTDTTALSRKWRQMVHREALAVQVLQLQPRARSPNWVPVTVTEVADMLRQARVREPWHEPELGCHALAQSINNPLGYQALGRRVKAVRRVGHESGVDDGRLVRTKASRARDAIEELRRALPDAIAALENSVAESFTLNCSSAEEPEQLRAIQDLPLATARYEILKQVLTLLDSLPPRQTQRKKAWWRLDAAKLWDLYRTMIDVSAGISPGGPAVRFIEAALARMGYRPLPTHIESALRDPVDWRNEFLRRRLDDVII
jgi:hypothetical protein